MVKKRLSFSWNYFNGQFYGFDEKSCYKQIFERTELDVNTTVDPADFTNICC